ncbi:hypothetical protein [Lentzea sp. NBRC 102530]|uniref:hypothetical protein n=1 Tax=Lentzea sp. NBRC 102530 TaxID=3032201 RepID=UPI0024A517C2|nr:hypothetical protein [Lentzea sp. NBRC 102530]GLY47759.1 hypothetical protein Lesp01_14150 [Lentzea sp. NBRC 102530]
MRALPLRAGPVTSAGDLLTAVARGDRTALGGLYDRLGALVFGLVTDALRTPTGQVDSLVAEEAALDAWTHVWRNAPALLRTSRLPLTTAEAITWIAEEVRQRHAA